MIASPSINPLPNDFTKVVDSGTRQEFDTGSVRDTRDGKGRFDLIPVEPLRRLARHYENGAKKYGDRNWEKGQPLSRYWDSAMRHMLAYSDGKVDEDHLAAIAWNIFAIIHTEREAMNNRLPGQLVDFGPYKDATNA